MTMAKRKAAPSRASGGKASTIAVTLRGSEEWKEWVERLADHCRSDVAKTIDRALVLLAKSEGFTEEPPAR
jgi:hypothetical protein